MSDLERKFHETWLGMAQPLEGLVVSIPVLIDAQCMERHGPADQARLVALVGDETPCIRDYPRFYAEFLGYPSGAFDDAPPEELKLDVVEGNQTLRPTRALKRQRPAPPKPDGLPDDSTPASRAGEPYLMLVWELPEGLDLDKKETQTGAWHSEPSAKFERLLRTTRVPIGLLANGHELRLVYAPHGESAGHLTFRLKDLTVTGGRPLMDALLMLLHARRFFGVLEEHALPAILEQSRRRQANVTAELAGQVFEALNILLGGFEAAAERDKAAYLEEALRRDDDHVYGGLLAVLLRMVFLLYAEDRGLMPMDDEPYGRDLSVKALFAELQQDATSFPDSMNRRHGAWGRLLALFRCVFSGASHGKLKMPPRRGQLFDPQSYPFLEGWTDGGAPFDASARSELKTPSIDDGTVFQVLERLMVLEGQRLSYQALDVEQIGSVYEALMGYHVKRLGGVGLCLRPNRVWVSADEVLEREPTDRAGWLEEADALDGKAAKAVADALRKAKTEEDVVTALKPFAHKNSEQRESGRLVLQPGAERRRTSSHYTPRSLSAPIVRRALEPLLKAMGQTPSSDRLLNLKICDPAMGSGAFLVEACRYLADQVVAAWTREGVLDKAPKNEDVVMRARRLVSQRCLYGVDKNPFAVNLAKLSLWLVTLAKDQPFTFLDHALKHGDSLVGLDLDQLRAFHWNVEKKKQVELASEVIKRALEIALSKRQKILQLALELERPAIEEPKQLGLDPAKEKEQLLQDADDALRPLRFIADACIGAFFGADSDKAREAERLRRLDLIGAWLAKAEGGELPAMPKALRDLPSPPVTFHWMLEYPEIFHGKRPDPLDAEQPNTAAWLDSLVGNPPFMYGGDVSGALGEPYKDWLLALHSDSSAKADLSAHFLRRAFDLLGKHGTLGFIATNSIAQGDTRPTGLQYVLANGGTIFDAIRSQPWPGLASVAVAVLHVSKGSVTRSIPSSKTLDGRAVPAINSRLRGSPERSDPVRLKSNADRSWNGTKIYGQGFVLTPEERRTLIERDRRNAELIKRYVGGEEINSDPSDDLERYVIDFGRRTLKEAEAWPDLLRIVRDRVKPERDRVRDNADGTRLKQFWWQFFRDKAEMYEAIKSAGRCLANSQVSKHLVWAWGGPGTTFSHAANILTVADARYFAALHSRVHEVWARLLSSSMRTDLRYAPSDCFETFPFPAEPAFSVLDDLGETLDRERRAYMTTEQVGLTTTYNRLKDPTETDPRIVALRELHERLDREVLAAYGWSDIPVPPYCGAHPKLFEAFEDEVLDRLFALNAERARTEAVTGAQSGPTKKASRTKRTSKA